MADGAFEAEDIVKYGYMMIKRPPTSTKVRIKAWQSKFFVLRDKSHNVPQRLEYYKDESAFEFQKPAEHSFCLDSVVYIGETRSSKSHCHPIMVVCGKQGAFTLACDVEEARKDWIQALNRVAVKINGNGSPYMWRQSSVDDSPATTPELTRRTYSEISTKPTGSSQNSEEHMPCGRLTRTRTVTSATTTTAPGYFVTTRLTPPSERNNIRGDYLLCVTEGEVVLKSVDSYLTVVTWPVGHLRSFKSESAAGAGVKDMQLLTLHAGSRSATGEGIFQFFTKHGDTITDEIRLRSQHAFKTVAQKREAFWTRSSSGNDATFPSTAQPAKKLQRGMTAPPQKFSNVLTKKDRGALMESLKRSRSDTAPSSELKAELNSSPAPADVAGNEASSTSHLRPRSSTDPVVEKTGDDDVFATKSTYCEIYNDDSGKEESDMNAYIELLSDDTAEPIHISDPIPSRKISNESLASTCSLASDEGSLRSSCSLSRHFSGTQLIPEENEMDAEGYVRSEALQTGPEENFVDRNGNNIDFLVSKNLAEVCEMRGTQSRSLPSCADDENKPKSGNLQLASNNSRLSRKVRENLLGQIADPVVGTLPSKAKLERKRPIMAENVYEGQPPSPDDPVDSLLEKARDPEGSRKLLDQIIAQMEKPQQHDVSELFPVSTRKRNSTGGVTLEAAHEIQRKLSGKGGHSQSFSFNKHAAIEKSKSTCDMFTPQALSSGPPPLPNRPDSVETPRRRVSSSVGDISEDLPRRPEHRATFFAKGMGSVNPQTLITPLRTNISAHLGGEAAIHARLIEKTEIRDELAQSSAKNKSAAAEDSSSCVIANGAAICSVADETTVNNADSPESSVKSSENIDGEDGQGDVGKRKDSKASKFVKKVWKLAPKPRRGSSDIRETFDEYSLPSDRPRRESLSPGDAMEIQGRFSGSEPNTPESSPKTGRKNSKTSPKEARKISSDEKVKKDKESSASKILGKMTKGDGKKNESGQKVPVRKISREESPKKDLSTADSAAKPFSSRSHKAAWPEKNTKDLKESYESEKMVDRVHGSDGQLRHAEDIGGRSTPTNDDFRDPAPALPPRKKFEPPPLPPRLPKSSPSVRPVSPPAHLSSSSHGAWTSREGRRHGSSSRHPSGSGAKEFLPPPPVPPRNSQSPEPKKMPANERSSVRAPVIQLTCSSPENPGDTSEKRNSDSDEDTSKVTAGMVPEQNPPTMSAAPHSPQSLSHPVPRRPSNGERKAQAKDFFRSHTNHHVYVHSSDSDDGEMEGSDLRPHSPRYGNIDEIRMAVRASEEEEALAKERASVGESGPQAPDCTESNYIKSSVNLSAGERRVIKSQREALRLKINMKKESSVDDDDGDDAPSAEGVKAKSKPKRPSTPLSIRRNVWTLSNVSIN